MNGELAEVEEDENNDYTALKNNYISITPIQHDMTDYKRLDYFKSLISKKIDLK
jgi:broad specificity polyphosphatase/5'/3'-nucleotidase SurE